LRIDTILFASSSASTRDNEQEHVLAVLVMRLLAGSLESEPRQSYLATYSWTALVAFLVGPAGLTIAAHFLGSDAAANQAIYVLYVDLLKWGLGPAAVCVYISYYLDRHTYSNLPDIDQSARTLGWRLLNCFVFAAATVFALLPALLALLRSSS
jgi:hypothetical protein